MAAIIADLQNQCDAFVPIRPWLLQGRRTVRPTGVFRSGLWAGQSQNAEQSVYSSGIDMAIYSYLFITCMHCNQDISTTNLP